MIYIIVLALIGGFAAGMFVAYEIIDRKTEFVFYRKECKVHFLADEIKVFKGKGKNRIGN